MLCTAKRLYKKYCSTSILLHPMTKPSTQLSCAHIFLTFIWLICIPYSYTQTLEERIDQLNLVVSSLPTSTPGEQVKKAILELSLERANNAMVVFYDQEAEDLLLDVLGAIDQPADEFITRNPTASHLSGFMMQAARSYFARGNGDVWRNPWNYNIETARHLGILNIGLYLDDQVIVDRVLRHADKSMRMQRLDGAMPYHGDDRPSINYPAKCSSGRPIPPHRC